MRKFIFFTVFFTLFITLAGCGQTADDFDEEAFVSLHAPAAINRLSDETSQDGLTDYNVVSMEWMVYTIEGSTDETSIDVQVVIYHIIIESDDEEHRYIFEYHTGEENGESYDGWQTWPSYIFESFPELISFIIEDIGEDLDSSIAFSHETGEFTDSEISAFMY